MLSPIGVLETEALVFWGRGAKWRKLKAGSLTWHYFCTQFVKGEKNQAGHSDSCAVSVFGRLRQLDGHELKTSLGYLVNSSL